MKIINNFTFNGIKKNYIQIVEQGKPYAAPRNVNIITVSGMKGGYVNSIDVDPIVIPLTIRVEANSPEQLNDRAEEIANWLTTDEEKELTFDVMPNRSYFALLNGAITADEIVSFSTIQIEFLCPKPFKFGPTVGATFPSDNVIVTYKGNAPSKPIIEMTVKQPSTFLNIQNQNGEYVMIGRPAPIDEKPYVFQELVMHDYCNNLNGWTVAGEVDNGYVAGNMAAHSYGYFYNEAVGAAIEPHQWQGPSIKRSIGTQLQNLRMDAEVELLNVGKGTGMLEIYLLDANNNTVMKIGIEDVWRNLDRVQGKFQLGNLDNRFQHYRQAGYVPAWNDFKGYLKLFRSGNRIRPYFALVDENGRYNWVSSSYVYTDYAGEYQAPIAQVQLAMRVHAPTWEKNDIRVKDIKFWRYNEEKEGIPYILEEGDIVTFNYETREILINGENRKDLIDFGSHFFDLEKGKNQLTVYPFDSVDTTMQYREVYR